jgi:hypothetical protein
LDISRTRPGKGMKPIVGLARLRHGITSTLDAYSFVRKKSGRGRKRITRMIQRQNHGV